MRAAETVKHAINGYLATCISFANELAALCDLTGVDALQVVDAFRLDARVSPNAPLRPGSGFSGGTLARDVQVLRRLGRERGYTPLFFEGVWQANQLQQRAPLRRLRQIYPSLEGLTIGLLGLTYKPGTSTVRRSAAVDMARDLTASGAAVRAFDPQADARELPRDLPLLLCASAEEAAQGTDALILATQWPEFRKLDFARIGAHMHRRVLVDGHNFLDQGMLIGAGFTYLGVGRGSPLAREGT